MNDLQHISTETLQRKKAVLLGDVVQTEKDLELSKSYLYQLSLNYLLKKLRKQIHQIDAELAFRGVKD